jgi:hypothetical protein
MSFQSCIDKLKSQTGKMPEDFKNQLEDEGLLKPELKAFGLMTIMKRNWTSNGNLVRAQVKGLAC